MSAPDFARSNLANLLRAAADGNLAHMECRDADSGQTRHALCARGQDGGDFVFNSFGYLVEGNPHLLYEPDEPASFLSASDTGQRT